MSGISLALTYLLDLLVIKMIYVGRFRLGVDVRTESECAGIYISECFPTRGLVTS